MVKRIRLTAKDSKTSGKKPAGKRERVRLNNANESASNTGGYEVGRNKPPPQHQFRKGDGRKRPGRPKGRKNIVTLVLEAAGAEITVAIDGKKRKISKAQSAAIQLANAGAMGNPKLLLKFIDLIAEIEARAEAARPSEYPFSDVDIKIIREIYKRLRPYDEWVND